MLYVIDAGVAVKWFIPEEDSAIAHRLLERYLQGLDTLLVRSSQISSCYGIGNHLLSELYRLDQREYIVHHRARDTKVNYRSDTASESWFPYLRDCL